MPSRSVSTETGQVHQALFERLVVHDDQIADAEVAEPFATLADPELPARLGREAVTEPALLLAAVQMRSY